MSYINDNFLLKGKNAETIYNNIKNLPICDYHCHLNEKEIDADKPFEDLFEVMLKYDHYKWRLMRFAGVSESYITGDKTPKEKWIKYCEVLESAYGNPLYHWTQLEIKKYFDCDLEINKENAVLIWDKCNEVIKNNNLSPVKLIQSSNVKYICTTNKVYDDLHVFQKINNKKSGFNVYPTFRPDEYLNIEKPNFKDLVAKIGCDSLNELKKILKYKLDQFNEVGCKVIDVSVAHVSPIGTAANANEAFRKALLGKSLTNKEIEDYKGHMLFYLLKIAGKCGDVTELHIGATRNNNSVMFSKLGPDSGFDAIGEDTTIDGLRNLFDQLNNNDSLGKIIVFNLNQKDNKQLVTLAGCFSNDKSKIQYGPAWWFLDNLDGINQQLKDLSALGHLGSFVGMLTDSRSFLSYERHQYFRRILANYLGEMMDNGLITQNIEKVIEVTKNISYYNSVNYFGF